MHIIPRFPPSRSTIKTNSTHRSSSSLITEVEPHLECSSSSTEEGYQGHLGVITHHSKNSNTDRPGQYSFQGGIVLIVYRDIPDDVHDYLSLFNHIATTVQTASLYTHNGTAGQWNATIMDRFGTIMVPTPCIINLSENTS